MEVQLEYIPREFAQAKFVHGMSPMDPIYVVNFIFFNELFCFVDTLEINEIEEEKKRLPRAGIEPALSGPQPDVLPLYYRGENSLRKLPSHSFLFSLEQIHRYSFVLTLFEKLNLTIKKKKRYEKRMFEL